MLKGTTMEISLQKCYESVTTDIYRVVLMHDEHDVELIKLLKQRGYSLYDVDLNNHWFLEIHNADKTIHTDKYGTFMFMFSFRGGIRLRDLQTKDILDNVKKLIDNPDKDYYFSLLTNKRKVI